jgi:hypothetical protein
MKSDGACVMFSNPQVKGRGALNMNRNASMDIRLN